MVEDFPCRLSGPGVNSSNDPPLTLRQLMEDEVASIHAHRSTDAHVPAPQSMTPLATERTIHQVAARPLLESEDFRLMTSDSQRSQLCTILKEAIDIALEDFALPDMGTFYVPLDARRQ
jgi:hypothetical protein